MWTLKENRIWIDLNELWIVAKPDQNLVKRYNKCENSSLPTIIITLHAAGVVFWKGTRKKSFITHIVGHQVNALSWNLSLFWGKKYHFPFSFDTA